jgi:hypothetical protein
VKYIELTKGYRAIVDDEDFEYLNSFHWVLSGNGYAIRREYIKGSGKKNQKNRTIRMHKVVNKTPTGFITDHINQNKLDNRRNNLRTVNKSQNGFNRPAPSNNTSGVKGVYWTPETRKWRATIKVNYKKYHLGYFLDLKEAERARKQGELTHHV